MKYLNMQERVDFVNAVVDNATQDGTFIPALLDIYFRIQVLIDICGVDFDKIPQEDYARVAYEDFFEKYEMDDTSDEQLTGLKEACKAEAKRRDDQMLAYLLYQKKSAADELFETLNNYLLKAEKSLDGVDLKELTESLGKLGSLDKEEVAKKTAELIAVDFQKNKGGDGTDGGEK